MFVLDSDHLSFLQRQAGPEFATLSKRCSAHRASDFFLTIVSFHEQFNGWTRFIARSQKASAWVRGYHELEGVITTFGRAQVLPFSPAAADIYEDLKSNEYALGAWICESPRL